MLPTYTREEVDHSIDLLIGVNPYDAALRLIETAINLPIVELLADPTIEVKVDNETLIAVGSALSEKAKLFPKEP
jgi:hypothetical protein